MDESVLDEDGSLETVLDGEGVDHLAFSEGHELGAGLEEERIGVGVGGDGGGEHLAVDEEAGAGAVALGVAADHGVVGEDAGKVDLGEDGGGVGER